MYTRGVLILRNLEFQSKPVSSVFLFLIPCRKKSFRNIGQYLMEAETTYRRESAKIDFFKKYAFFPKYYYFNPNISVNIPIIIYILLICDQNISIYLKISDFIAKNSNFSTKFQSDLIMPQNEDYFYFL